MTDYISRAEAIEAVRNEIQDFEKNYMQGEDDENFGHDIGFVAGLYRARHIIRELPSADSPLPRYVMLTENSTIESIRPQGEWIDVNGDGSLWRCDQCKDTACCKGNFCNNCGAKMKGGDTE